MTIIDQARAILHANDRGGYTVPTDRLYPFQWNWDSAFVAMGFATWDVDRALTELERLVQGQWADGMIPHIIFHQPSDTYFPGPDVWRTSHAVATSGISQPPVFGYALAFIAERAEPRHEPRIAALYRAALSNLRWWRRARDPEGRGLIAILHNWESGRDNSPEWDRPFARVPETTVTPVRRRDTGHVDAAMRPTDADYRRYIHLVDAYAAAGWEPARMWSVAPFKIADIGVNALFVASAQALRRLALVHGAAGDADWLAAVASTPLPWSERAGCFISIDLSDDAPIEVTTSAGFLPLLVNATTPAQVERLAGHAEALFGRGLLPVPSTFPDQAGYEPKRYWRGPVWAVVNWMIARGFDRQGHAELARRLDAALANAIDRAGFCEYFDPETGEGLGGHAFSWTAAIRLLIADARGDQPSRTASASISTR